MDIKEASWRVLGADDFIRLFLKTLENTKNLKQEDRIKLLDMMNDLRMILILRYQKEIKSEQSPVHN